MSSHWWCHRSMVHGSTTKPWVQEGSGLLSPQAPCLGILVPSILPRSAQWPWGQVAVSVYFPRLLLAVGVGQGCGNGGKKVASSRGEPKKALQLAAHSSVSELLKVLPVLKNINESESGYEIKRGIHLRLWSTRPFLHRQACYIPKWGNGDVIAQIKIKNPFFSTQKCTWVVSSDSY